MLPIVRKVLFRIDSNRHRRAVGGKWDELGKLQLEFLVEHGLKPEHKLLDIGCGSLRAGVHLIKLLNDGNYFGVEKDKEVLSAGLRIEIPHHHLSAGDFSVVVTDNFDFSVFNTEFDYVLAQSVFTELTQNTLIRCIMNVETVLVRGGRFYATFWENRQGKFNLDPVDHTGGATTYFDRASFHYDFDTFVNICKDTSLEVEYIGDWGHPRDQKMIVFKKS